MYAVIFKAKVKQFDEAYFETAKKMRDRAIEKYGCLNFVANSEGDNEMAISYWPSLEAIQQWKQDELHLEAQILGKQSWYDSYQVEVVEVLRQYQG